MTIIHKAVAESDGLDFVLSDATVDRYGEVVEPDGWDLRNFKKNPIALFGHNSNFPVGKWSDLRVEDGRLKGRLNLAKRGTSYRLDELIGLIEQGILRAVSVGFRPLKAEPMDPERPYGPQKYLKQELLETSVVSVPANPAALALAKSMKISNETMTLAFGEQAEVRRDMSAPGEHADSTNEQERARAGLRSPSKGTTMTKTISQRVQDAKDSLVAKQKSRDTLVNADDLDHDAIDAINDEIETLEKDIAVLERTEKTVSKAAAPNINRQPLGNKSEKLSGLDLMVRRAVVHGIAAFTGADVQKTLDERYPGHDEQTHLAVVAKAAAPLATTGTSGFVSQLVQSTWAGFLDALRGESVYPELRDRGTGVSFDAAGTAYLPQRTGSGANGSFFAEGSPMRVGRITVAAPTFTSRKMGVIIPFSREAAKRATPQLEGVLRKAIVEDTAATLDGIMLDATAEDTVRPAGLLYGVPAVASGYGGGDYTAVKEDFKALLTPFIEANAASGITVIMNPKQGLNISLMDGPENNVDWFRKLSERVTIVESTHATAGRLIAIRNTDFATALGDMPEFEISNQATIHMEDTTPAEIVSATGPTTANPVRSFWQTDSSGLRMVMDVSWKMARSGMVQWIDGTSY
jgi:HK97 family phage prohead protease/HK97 family phage major capsid protein